jgi:transcriptional regulator with AAA-type ATPase domain
MSADESPCASDDARSSRAEVRVERFPLALARERWPEFLALEHATLPLPLEVAGGGEELRVFRARPPGRPVQDGRIPRTLVPELLLQAASALAFFRAFGIALRAEDLTRAHWDRTREGARLWLAGSPAALSERGDSPSPSRALAALLDRIGGRGGRVADTRLCEYARFLEEPETRSLRAESLVARLFRSFPALATRGGALARRRTAGSAGSFLRSLCSRAVVAAGRAALEGRRARVFRARGSTLAGGSALPLDPPPSSGADASKRLRALAMEDASSGRTAWIAAGVESWDALSRRAFETAARCLSAEVEVRFLSSRETPPTLPDEWRREIFVPCGSLAASLRFYEWLADAARPNPHDAETLVLASLASDSWAAFAADPTGHVPLPSILRPEASPRRSRRRRAERSAGLSEGAVADPASRIEALIAAGRADEALEEAARWRRESPARSPEAWFDLSARLALLVADRPPWLDLLEAERHAAGGSSAEARELLERVVASKSATPEERRQAALRAAEITSGLEGAAEAARRAAEWRRDFPAAPASEAMRSLRLEAVGLARDGAHRLARERLDESDSIAGDATERDRIENVLARATVLSLEGRFSEESELYERWRPAVLELADDAVAARFLSREALGLCDRRRYAEAAARLEEARSVLRDDPAESARLSLDLAATLYHAGRSDRCASLLEDAQSLAATAGRRDLLRLARSNAIELAISECRWPAADEAIGELLAEAEDSGDELWRLVALHHRSRAALRRGELERAGEDNAAARALAEKLGDRLEVGELWLEEGDRLLYGGDTAAPRAFWERAASDPPDRCDTERIAAVRLRELDWRSTGGPPREAREEISARLSEGNYSAAETVARWTVLFGARAVSEEARATADQILRSGGGSALADRVFGRRPTSEVASVPIAALRDLRETLAAALAGQDGSERLASLGFPGLGLDDAEGQPLLRVGRLPDGDGTVRILEAGSARYRLRLPNGISEPLSVAAALLAETLLFRPPGSLDGAGFAEGWRRLGIVTADPSMEEPWRRLARFAPQNVTVLVHGESGSGKEAVARAVHQLSPRAAGPFVPVNVPAIPAALLESELFGHVRGAFTGAERDRAGLLEEASRGTLFLDEIGDLAPALQAKLLRTLQDRELRRVGENRSRRIDVRVVSATSRDLAREVEAGRFREDLFYRLHVAVIELPPLRRRGRDVLVLARHFLDGFAREFGRGALKLAPESVGALHAHSWPGNVRELQNAMAQAAALADRDGAIGLPQLPEVLRQARVRYAPGESYRSRLDAHRRGMISEALEQAGGNRALAARRLGLSRQALRYLVRELGIPAGGAAGDRRASRVEAARG